MKINDRCSPDRQLYPKNFSCRRFDWMLQSSSRRYQVVHQENIYHFMSTVHVSLTSLVYFLSFLPSRMKKALIPSCAPSPRLSESLPTSTGTTVTRASWSKALESAPSVPKSATKHMTSPMPNMGRSFATVELKRTEVVKLW